MGWSYNNVSHKVSPDYQSYSVNISSTVVPTLRVLLLSDDEKQQVSLFILTHRQLTYWSQLTHN